MTGVGGGFGGSVAAPFALDGTPSHDTNTSGSSWTTTAFSTTHTNDVVYIATQANGGPVISITGGGLSWSKRAAGFFSGSSGPTFELWSAIASSSLSGAQFTVTQTSSSFFASNVFAFSGSHIASPFDGNAAIPNLSTTNAAFATCTTTNSNDILVGAASVSGGTQGSNWTLATAIANGLLSIYQSVSSPQVSESFQDSGGSLANGGVSICDAIIKGP